MKAMVLSILLSMLWSCGGYSTMSQSDIESGKIIKEFVKAMKPYGLHAAGTGGGARDGKINLVDVVFRTDEMLDIERARSLIVVCRETLLSIINDNPENEKYFIEFPVTDRVVVIRIIGPTQDSKMSKNSLKSVGIYHGDIRYLTYDPEGKVKPYLEVHQESIDEAKQILKEDD